MKQKTSPWKSPLPYILFLAVALCAFGLYTLLVKSVTITTYPASSEVWLNGELKSASTPATLHLWCWQTYRLELKPSSDTKYKPVTYDFIGYQAPRTLSVLLQYINSYVFTSTPGRKWELGRKGDSMIIARSMLDGKTEVDLAPQFETIDGQEWENMGVAASVFSPDESAVLLVSYLVDETRTKDCGKMGSDLDTFLWLVPIAHPEGRYPIFKGINPDGSSCIGGYGFSPDGEWVYETSTFTSMSGQRDYTLVVVSTSEGGAPQILSRVPSVGAYARWSPDGSKMIVCRSNMECFFYTLTENDVWQKTDFVLQGIGAFWVDNDRLWYIDTTSPEQHYLTLYQMSSHRALYHLPLDEAVAEGYRYQEVQQGDLVVICMEYSTIPNVASLAAKLVIANSGKSPSAVVFNLEYNMCYEPYFLEDGAHIAMYTGSAWPGYTDIFYHTEILNIPPELLK